MLQWPLVLVIHLVLFSAHAQNLRWRGPVHHYHETIDQLGTLGRVHRPGVAVLQRSVLPFHPLPWIAAGVAKAPHLRYYNRLEPQQIVHPPTPPPAVDPWLGAAGPQAVPVYAPPPPPQDALAPPSRAHALDCEVGFLHHQHTPHFQAPSSHAQLDGWAMNKVSVQDTTGAPQLNANAFCVTTVTGDARNTIGTTSFTSVRGALLQL